MFKLIGSLYLITLLTGIGVSFNPWCRAFFTMECVLILFHLIAMVSQMIANYLNEPFYCEDEPSYCERPHLTESLSLYPENVYTKTLHPNKLFTLVEQIHDQTSLKVVV